MINKRFLLFFLLFLTLFNFVLLPVVFAQTQQLTTEEWVVVTLAGVLSSVITIWLTNLIKKIPGINKVDGASSLTSLTVSFMIVWGVDKIVSTHLTLAHLWFLTLNLQTLAQIGSSLKPNFVKKDV